MTVGCSGPDLFPDHPLEERLNQYTPIRSSACLGKSSRWSPKTYDWQGSRASLLFAGVKGSLFL